MVYCSQIFSLGVALILNSDVVDQALALVKWGNGSERIETITNSIVVSISWLYRLRPPQ